MSRNWDMEAQEATLIPIEFAQEAPKLCLILCERNHTERNKTDWITNQAELWF